MKTLPPHPDPIKLKINLENMPHSVYRRILMPENINMLLEGFYQSSDWSMRLKDY